MPVTAEQIKIALNKYFGNEARSLVAINLIAEVHDLQELSSRPYLLPLIANQLAHLEQAKAKGQAVNAVNLYRGMVEEWLLSDDGKHTFTGTGRRYQWRKPAEFIGGYNRTRAKSFRNKKCKI